jgi:GNAT superfamily N-acetyltransferase
MKIFYEQSHDGYQIENKRNELFSNQSRYLVIRLSNCLIAFTHFQFDMDYGNRVIYLYELQVNRNYQGQGLGKWIIEQLKILCQKTQMSKIVLTVHKNNTKAIEFYMKKCQFKIDMTNPEDEQIDYLILSCSI